MPPQEAWHKFNECHLEAGNSIDVYLDQLQRFGRRVGLSTQDLAFRVKFYEGLPTSVYEWAVSHESAYTADFGAVLARVRDRLVMRRAASGRQQASDVVPVATAGQQQQKKGNNRGCFRCGGDHFVKVCPTTCKKGKQPAKAPAGKTPGCFRCGSAEHFVKECPGQGHQGTAKDRVFRERALDEAARPLPWKSTNHKQGL